MRLLLRVEGPLAHVDDRAAGRVERAAQLGVREGHLRGRDEAAVRLHVVDAPRGERARVDLLVRPRGGQPGARERADVRVESEPEAARVRLRIEQRVAFGVA